MSIKQLLSKRADALNSAKLVSTAAKTAGRDLTDAEVLQIEGHLDQAENCQSELDTERGLNAGRIYGSGDPPGRIEAAEAWGKETQPTPRHLLPRVDGGPDFHGPANRTLPHSDGAGSFGEYLVGPVTEQSGFSSFGEFLQVADSGKFDVRLQASGMKSDVLSTGGALIPAEYLAGLIDAAMERTILLQRATKFPMSSDTLNISCWDGNTHTSRSLFGGWTAAWSTQIGTLTPQDAKTRQITLRAKKCAILTQSSNELLYDADSYDKMLGEALVEAMAWELDYQLIAGTGAGRPQGCLNTNSKIEVTKESSQTAATIWYTNLVKMFARLHPSCYENALWLANPKTIPQLLSLDTHESATALGSTLVGDNTYSPFVETAGKFTLFGRPVFMTEKCSTLGTAGDIILVDPTKIAFGMRKEITVESSGHAGFTTDSTYHRAIARVDATPMWAKVFTPQAGDTLSWCITLQDRS